MPPRIKASSFDCQTSGGDGTLWVLWRSTTIQRIEPVHGSWQCSVANARRARTLCEEWPAQKLISMLFPISDQPSFGVDGGQTIRPKPSCPGNVASCAGDGSVRSRPKPSWRASGKLAAPALPTRARWVNIEYADMAATEIGKGLMILRPR